MARRNKDDYDDGIPPEYSSRSRRISYSSHYSQRSHQETLHSTHSRRASPQHPHRSYHAREETYEERCRRLIEAEERQRKEAYERQRKEERRVSYSLHHSRRSHLRRDDDGYQGCDELSLRNYPSHDRSPRREFQRSKDYRYEPQRAGYRGQEHRGSTNSHNRRRYERDDSGYEAHDERSFGDNYGTYHEGKDADKFLEKGYVMKAHGDLNTISTLRNQRANDYPSSILKQNPGNSTKNVHFNLPEEEEVEEGEAKSMEAKFASEELEELLYKGEDHPNHLTRSHELSVEGLENDVISCLQECPLHVLTPENPKIESLVHSQVKKITEWDEDIMELEALLGRTSEEIGLEMECLGEEFVEPGNENLESESLMATIEEEEKLEEVQEVIQVYTDSKVYKGEDELSHLARSHELSVEGRYYLFVDLNEMKPLFHSLLEVELLCEATWSSRLWKERIEKKDWPGSTPPGLLVLEVNREESLSSRLYKERVEKKGWPG